MSAIEGAVSVGSVGVAAAGPSIGASAGASIGGEIGISGIGFDGGSPSFSGLGRSDTGLGSFSINEGSKGPVSFSNSTDLFSETRSFVGSLASVPEGAVKGDIFSGEMQTLASNPDLGMPNPAANEKTSIFSEFAPFQVTIPTTEGPAPLSSFDGFTTIASFSEPSFGFESETEQDSQASIGAVIGSETVEMGLEENSIKSAVEDLRTNDPLTYMQLKSDLALVQNIVDLATEETDPETSTAISNAAINVAVERSGLIQALEQAESSVESATQTDEETQTVTANVQAIVESVSPPEKEVVEPRPVQPKDQYFVDEEANDARRSKTARAIKQAFEEEIDPETGKVKGNAVVDILPVELPAEEISEIVLKEGGRTDGSEAQRRNHLSLLEFSTEEEALEANERLIAENNAVTDNEAANRATEAEAAKVKSGVKAQIKELEIFPLAA